MRAALVERRVYSLEKRRELSTVLARVNLAECNHVLGSSHIPAKCVWTEMGARWDEDAEEKNSQEDHATHDQDAA